MESRPRIRRTKARQTLAVAEPIVRAYVACRDALKQLGVLRTERSLQGDYAEWLAAEILGLKLCENTVERDYDAQDARGRRYQVKARIVGGLEDVTSFDFRTREAKFDFLIAVFFSRSFSVLAVVQVPRCVVLECGTQTQSTFRFRWNKRTATDTRILRVYWSPADKGVPA